MAQFSGHSWGGIHKWPTICFSDRISLCKFKTRRMIISSALQLCKFLWVNITVVYARHHLPFNHNLGLVSQWSNYTSINRLSLQQCGKIWDLGCWINSADRSCTKPRPRAVPINVVPWVRESNFEQWGEGYT